MKKNQRENKVCQLSAKFSKTFAAGSSTVTATQYGPIISRFLLLSCHELFQEWIAPYPELETPIMAIADSL